MRTRICRECGNKFKCEDVCSYTQQANPKSCTCFKCYIKSQIKDKGKKRIMTVNHLEGYAKLICDLGARDKHFDKIMKYLNDNTKEVVIFT